MRPQGTQQQLEKRRREAVSLVQQGYSFRDAAKKVKASLSSVVRWCQAHREQGAEGLQTKKAWGRPCQLTEKQKKDLQKRLLKGALAAGYATDLWTLGRIANLIEDRYGQSYTEVGVWKLLHVQLGWSCQKPERRALERDEDAIRHWKRYVWPHIKKGQKTWGPFGIS